MAKEVKRIIINPTEQVKKDYDMDKIPINEFIDNLLRQNLKIMKKYQDNVEKDINKPHSNIEPTIMRVLVNIAESQAKMINALIRNSKSMGMEHLTDEEVSMLATGQYSIEDIEKLREEKRKELKNARESSIPKSDS